jgi:hypothetical protein
VNLASTVTGGGKSLTINGSGVTTFGGNVSGVSTLTTDSAGTTAINAAMISTTGAQTYNDAVTLGNTIVTLDSSSGSGNITFSSPVNGAGSYILSLDAGTGSISLNNVSVGTLAFTAGTNLTLNGDISVENPFDTTPMTGTIILAGPSSITTTNDAITLNTAVSMGENALAMDAGAGNITLNGTVTGGNTGGTFTIGGAGAIDINQDISVKAITINNFDTIDLAEEVDLKASNGGILVSSGNYINLSGRNGYVNKIESVTIGGPPDAAIDLINIQSTNNPSLRITSDGNAILDTVNVKAGDLYIEVDHNDNELSSLFAEYIAAFLKELKGNNVKSATDLITAYNILSADKIVFDGDVVLSTNSSYSTTSGQPIQFNGKVYTDGTGNYNLTVNTAGQTYFKGNIGNEGSATVLGTLTTDSAGTTLIDSNVINAKEINLGDTVTFNNALSLNSAGNIIFSKTVNGTSAGLLDLTANQIRLYNNVTTNGGNINFTGPVTLLGDVIMSTGGGTAGAITLNNNVQGAFDLTLVAGTMDIRQNVILTGGGDLSLTVTSAGASLGSISDPIDTQISGTLTANAAGGLYINNTGNLTVISNVNNISINASGNISLTEANDLDLGPVYAGGGTLYIQAGGSLTDTNSDSSLTSNNLTLAAAGGIGSITNPISTTTTGKMSLNSGIGDIGIVETNGVNTSDLTLTTGTGTQNVSLSFGGTVTTGAPIGNSADNLILTSRNGSIINGGGMITAYDLTLRAGGSNASIGEPWDETTGVTTIEKYQVTADTDTSNPVLISVAGTLTAIANNGDGGIFLKMPELVAITASKGTAEYTTQYKTNSITFASIDAGENGNIGITLAGSLNGNVVPLTYNYVPSLQGFYPVYTNSDYTTPNLDNMIRGNYVIIKADTIGLTAAPQLDVYNIKAMLSGVESKTYTADSITLANDYSAVLGVENPVPVVPGSLDPALRGGGKLGDYPPDPKVYFPNRLGLGIVQLGAYPIPVDANLTGLLSTSALIVISPQQEALEELLRKSGGEDFFMTPPLWIDIEMEQEEEKMEEEEEFEDEFSYFKGPDLFGTPDLNNVKDMPSLLGQNVQDKEGAPLIISALKRAY